MKNYIRIVNIVGYFNLKKEKERRIRNKRKEDYNLTLSRELLLRSSDTKSGFGRLLRPFGIFQLFGRTPILRSGEFFCP